MTTSITSSSITTTDLTVDSADNLLKVDHATNKVGIGTSNPSKLLTLKADSTEETMLMFQNDSAVDIGAISIHPSNGLVVANQVPGSSVHIMTHDGNEDINLDSDGFIQIEVAGTEMMHLNATGVGIGTNNPLSIFHIGGGGDANVPITVAPSTGGNAEFRNTSSTGSFTFTNANGSSERMRIDSSGRVKIGTNETTIGDQQLFISGTKTSFANTSFSLWQNQLAVHDNRIPSGGAGTEAGVGGSISFTAESGGGQTTWLGLVEGYKQNSTAGDYGGGLKMRVRQHNNPTMLTGISIDSTARVTMPNQPSFQAYRSQSAWTVTAGSIFVFNNTEHNIGSHYNTGNGRFTAPVAGTYQFSFHTIYTGNSGNDWISIRKNGARINGGDYHFSTTPGTQWDTIGGSLNLYLNINDHVSMYAGTEHVYHGGNWSNFGGHLVG